MALTDSAVLVPGVGHILIATVGAAAPTYANLVTFAGNTATMPTGFTNLGHTSIDDVWVPDQDGGETDVKGSWQNASLREVVTSQAIDFYTVKSLQINDNVALSLYYGGGDFSDPNQFDVPDSPAPQEKAAIVVFLDGSDVMGFYTPKVSIFRADAIEAAADDFMTLPLKFTVLKNSTDPKIRWIGEFIGTP